MTNRDTASADSALFAMQFSVFTSEDILRNADSVSELRLAIKLNSKRPGDTSGHEGDVKLPDLELKLQGQEEEVIEEPADFMKSA